ncbi:melanoma-associated antigen B10-like [Octodon degus]|uniref:Melanoma-associated antigen B10-like n=1 Tax=Octodon degus TaxID=10160 RepID=A0A6P3FRB9_OCTDE|nr:melanoma-associated antigen B10-like [Octodon degus]
MNSRQVSQSSESSSWNEEEDICNAQDEVAVQFLSYAFIDDSIARVLTNLIWKYQKQETITKADMLRTLGPDYDNEQTPVFKKLYETMCMNFGIEMREVDPTSHTYALLPILGLTYNGIYSANYQCLSKIDLLIVILTIIFVKGNCASEDDIKEYLRKRDMLAQNDHFVLKEPWKFITEKLVELGYLEYRQVANSDPARYEFLWGPRAHAETTKMKVLEHLAKVNRREPSTYPRLYADALGQEQEAAHASDMDQ